LQVGVIGPLRLVNVLEAIAGSVQRTFGRPIHFQATGDSAPLWVLPEAEAIPIALTVNELLTNAIKHSAKNPEDAVNCYFVADGPDGVVIVISNTANLPPGFKLSNVPGGVSGLGLVRALMPRRNAQLKLEQSGAQVVASVALSPPCVSLWQE
jgi:two-component sensor histidine kinase